MPTSAIGPGMLRGAALAALVVGCLACGSNRVVGDLADIDGTHIDSRNDIDIPSGWIRVTAGAFKMGSPVDEPCRVFNETLHPVTLTNAFMMMSKEVTRAEFVGIAGYDPCVNKLCVGDCPVNGVSWHAAADYCNRLSQSSGASSCYSCAKVGSTVRCSVAAEYLSKPSGILDCSGFRLPTEAEWEYAYRAGSTTAFYHAPNTAAGCHGKDPALDLIAWYKENAGGSSQPVGRKLPNKWGFFDLSGNLYEWTNDHYVEDLGTSSVVDPIGPWTGYRRVSKGGAWTSSPVALRAATRWPGDPESQDGNSGFRCARSAP